MALTIIIILLSLAFSHQKYMKDESSGEGFTLELIHRDSIHSPLHLKNFTSIEKLKRKVLQSKAYVLSQESTVLDPEDVNIRPIVSHDKLEYMVKLGIGTPPTNLHLMMDTGSDLIWTQCEPCSSECFGQDGVKFNPNRSITFNPISCDHSLCKPPYRCIDGRCTYTERYGDDTSTKGVLATEIFTFNSKLNRTKRIPNIVFGCSHTSNRRMFATRMLGGILGMSSDKKSLLMQISQLIKGPLRFSYCLTKDDNSISYLRFGEDIKTNSKLQHIPMKPTNARPYNLELVDIAVNKKRLRLPKGSFVAHSNGSGGCMADTGTEFGFMANPPYNRLKQKIIRYFRTYNLEPIGRNEYGLDLCYRMPNSSFNSFPSLDYHFAKPSFFSKPVLRVEGENLFHVTENMFCMMMVEAKGTIIGSAFQRNVQFVYDITKQRVSFGRENCARL